MCRNENKTTDITSQNCRIYLCLRIYIYKLYRNSFSYLYVSDVNKNENIYKCVLMRITHVYVYVFVCV